MAILFTTSDAYSLLNGVKVTSVPLQVDIVQQTSTIIRKDNDINIGQWIQSSSCKSMIVFGTYAADFNAIEYGQRLRYYWPILQKEKGIKQCALILNCNKEAAIAYKRYVDLPDSIELWIDEMGDSGRTFGVQRGWIPDNNDVPPFLKLFVMLFGIGAWATLPAVIGGYIGNPFVPQPWIVDAFAVGMRQGRWPDNAIILDDNMDQIIKNKFDDLPVVGSWPRKPLELATLRLQSMLGISLSHWNELAPNPIALDAGILTQLGGCLVVDSSTTSSGDVVTILYEWKDPGICAVANFEDIVKKI